MIMDLEEIKLEYLSGVELIINSLGTGKEFEDNFQAWLNK